MKLEYIVIFSAIINSIWWFVYIKNTLKWITKPNKVSRSIFTIAPFITVTATIYSQWFVWSVIPVFMAWFIPLLILISSFFNKNSYWKLWKLDYWCFFFAILSLILWYITNNPLIAIIFSVLADLLWYIPTMIKVYKYPETETMAPFTAWLFANFTALLVVKTWIPEEFLFPLYIVLANSLVIFLYYRKKIFKNKIKK